MPVSSRRARERPCRRVDGDRRWIALQINAFVRNADVAQPCALIFTQHFESIDATTRPLARPAGADGHLLLLYSGNWGMAHDYETFLAAYAGHHREGSGRFLLWLNAVGGAAGQVETRLKQAKLPYLRSQPVPLANLASLLVTPDAHLITLLDPFVGFVLPSKVYGCVASGRPVLFVGSERSDVHLVCMTDARERYLRADVGDVEGCRKALDDLAARLDAGGSQSATTG